MILFFTVGTMYTPYPHYISAWPCCEALLYTVHANLVAIPLEPRSRIIL